MDEERAKKRRSTKRRTRRMAWQKMKIDGYFLITYSISLLQSVSWQQRKRREMENKKINVICC